jgi:hypothetical protein
MNKPRCSITLQHPAPAQRGDCFNSFLRLLVLLQTGTTALHYAAMQAHLEVAAALAEASWSVDACDKVRSCSASRRGFNLRHGTFPKRDHCIVPPAPAGPGRCCRLLPGLLPQATLACRSCIAPYALRPHTTMRHSLSNARVADFAPRAGFSCPGLV